MSGTFNLTVTSPPQSFTELLTLAQVEHFLGLVSLSPDDAERTALLEGFISGAREQAEILQGRDLVQKQYDLSLDSFADFVIELRPNLVTVDLVQYRDSGGTWTTLAEGTDYIVDTAHHPGSIQPVYGGTWPSFTAWPISAVLVRFTAGLAASDIFWSDAGDRVKTGMKLLISHWYNGRLPFDASAGAIQEYPYAVTTLLSQGSVARRF